jgi:starch phosphorylase
MPTTLDHQAVQKITPDSLREAVAFHARYSVGKQGKDLTNADYFTAVARAVRDRLMDRLLETEERYQQSDAKRVYYLSMEFLMGRSLRNNLSNLGVYEICRDLLRDLGVDYHALEEREPDAALGNGGLGRLAACFLDSLATLGMPGFGYGINYEYGLFRQEILGGQQKEQPDNWLAFGTPWEVEHPAQAVIVPAYGRIEHGFDRFGNYNPMWLDWKVAVGVPYDFPIVGYGGKTVNYLRLYSARSSRDFDMTIFNDGDYFKAVEQKISSETISKVLYPSDAVVHGKELRLVQEYFLTACAIRDIIRRYLKTHEDFEQFGEKVAIQLNDTHPTLAVAELMRYLVDERSLDWDESWRIVQQVFGYTNHTLLPEALEKWSVPLMEYVLPRHMQIIYEINHRFLELVAKAFPGDNERLGRMSIIEEANPKQVRMAHLAMVGSHSINGVAALHSELVKTQLVPDFYALWPKKFNNKTNGVTQRRWLLACNPQLAELLTKTVGDGWVTNLDKLRDMEPKAKDESFQQEFRQIKKANKANLARLIQDTIHLKVDPETIFDVQIKRIHEYKRQLLNVLHVIHRYLCIVEDGQEPVQPRTCIFAGKAAPGYWAAKQIIRLIHSVGKVINNDPRVKDRLKLLFLPDYRVTLAETIIPAADLSEQISTAGMEASGTGNMKFALNGALTIGTLDGANVEIMQSVGEENIFIFGLKAHEVEEKRKNHSYRPQEYYQNVPAIRRVLDTFKNGRFSPEQPDLYQWIFQSLVERGDFYFHLADLEAYIAAQDRVERTYKDRKTWDRMAVLNVARIGMFSSDRTIKQYADDIWSVKPVV